MQLALLAEAYAGSALDGSLHAPDVWARLSDEAMARWWNLNIIDIARIAR